MVWEVEIHWSMDWVCGGWLEWRVTRWTWETGRRTWDCSGHCPLSHQWECQRQERVEQVEVFFSASWSCCLQNHEQLFFYEINPFIFLERYSYWCIHPRTFVMTWKWHLKVFTWNIKPLTFDLSSAGDWDCSRSHKNFYFLFQKLQLIWWLLVETMMTWFLVSSLLRCSLFWISACETEEVTDARLSDCEHCQICSLVEQWRWII